MNPQVYYLESPVTVCNESLDLIGAPEEAIMGDLNDGTRVAEAARRNYGQALRRLLRTAAWDFARKHAKLTLLGDATTTTPAPGVSPYVESPWSYCYEWPIDAVMGRWLPWNPTNAQPENNSGTPLTTGSSAVVPYGLIPGRYLVASSDQYPVVVGAPDWDQMPDLETTEGVGPIARKVILTNCCNAHFVYTRLSTHPEEWDSLFRQALVTMMGLVFAPIALTDPKMAAAQRDRLIPLLKNAVDDARVANGNETGYPQSTDFESSYIRGRTAGVWGGLYTTPGYGGTSVIGSFGNYGGWESMSFGGSVF